MFFGMCNSLATFQAMMDSIFDDMISDSLIIIYMDNMFIFKKDLSPLITIQDRSYDDYGTMIYI